MGDTVLSSKLCRVIKIATQVEAILNLHLLTPMSNDLLDFTALTSGHFLISSYLRAIQELSHYVIHLNRLKRWQLVQALHQRTWKQWQLEYLHTLQHRSKWTTLASNLLGLTDLFSSTQPLLISILV